MKRTKLEFTNTNGEKLAGLIELPDQPERISGFALFAHCFTCGKDIAAASRISRALAAKGIGVLRFDFTGLGGSDGDFANTNFSSNIADVVEAAHALESAYQAPQLLIGHSLGGAAVLSAATQLESIKAVVTIGAPATAKHIIHFFRGHSEKIRSRGEAVVALGGREFSIKKQFLEDVDKFGSTSRVRDLGSALLVFHAPLDTIVSIDEAAKIFQAARHPKSFVSLDKADHLLSKAADAEYVADTIASWASRYVVIDTTAVQENSPEIEPGEVVVTELDRKFRRGMHTNSHYLQADEPRNYGGTDSGPTPYDLLLMSLGACTSMTLRMYANRKKLPLEDIVIKLAHERVHAEDCNDCTKQIEQISRHITLKGPLTKTQREKLLEIADRCPVHRTLENSSEIVSELT